MKRIKAMLAAVLLAGTGFLGLATASAASAATAAPRGVCNWVDHADSVVTGNAGYGVVSMDHDPCGRWWWGQVKCSLIRNGSVSYWHAGRHKDRTGWEDVGCKSSYQPAELGIDVRKADGAISWTVLWG